MTQGDFTHFLWKHCVTSCHSRGCRLGISANAYSAVKKSDTAVQCAARATNFSATSFNYLLWCLTPIIVSTVDSGNSKRLDSKQSLISKHFWCRHRLFYNINYMLNSKHLSLVNKIGDKTKFTITRVHCIM